MTIGRWRYEEDEVTVAQAHPTIEVWGAIDSLIRVACMQPQNQPSKAECNITAYSDMNVTPRMICTLEIGPNSVRPPTQSLSLARCRTLCVKADLHDDYQTE